MPARNVPCRSDPQKAATARREAQLSVLEQSEEVLPDNTIGVLVAQHVKVNQVVDPNGKVAILDNGQFIALRGGLWLPVVPTTKRTASDRKRILWKPK